MLEEGRVRANPAKFCYLFGFPLTEDLNIGRHAPFR
jgi:hypothetical protein